MPAKKIKTEDIKLEAAMKRLDEVVRALDSDGLELEESLKLYEEGVGLVRICHEKLSEAERRITALRVNNDGELVEDEFDRRQDGE
jgi:exodeoxyribonuclease VII small subunit